MWVCLSLLGGSSENCIGVYYHRLPPSKAQDKMKEKTGGQGLGLWFHFPHYEWLGSYDYGQVM